MNKPSDDLFALIQSLTQSEKKHFKHFTSKKGGNKKYLKLFTAIENQKVYDEVAIKKLFRGEKFISQLGSIKNYLHYLISKSLESCHAESTIDSELRSYIHRIEIFFNKGLYKQCEKIIGRARHLAEKHEKHLSLLELSNWEVTIFRSQSYKGKTQDDIEKLYSEIFNIQSKYSHEKELELLSTKMFIEVFKGFTRSNADLIIYQEIMNHPLLLSSPDHHEATSQTWPYRSLYHYYNIHAAYFFIKHDLSKAYFYYKQLLKFMDDNPDKTKEELHMYIGVLLNLITCQLYLKKYDGMSLSLKKLKSINTSSQYLKNKIFFITHDMELAMYIKSGEFDKGVKLIATIHEGVNKFALSNIDKLVLYYGIFYIYFGVSEYHNARNYLNKIINDSAVALRSDLYCMARIVLLLVHYELGNEELLGYLEKSAHRYLDKKERLYKVETSILDFMRKEILKVINPKGKIQVFKELKTEMEEIMKDPYEKKSLEYFDFISWLESKIEKRPFAEIVREKAALKDKAGQ